MAKLFILFGGSLGLLGVVFGAFGAHALKERLTAAALSSWETAVSYQMYHALALLFVGLWLLHDGPSSLRYVGMLFAAGVVLFSGSIYALVLGAGSWFGPITPLGGVTLIAAWATLIYSSLAINN
jgi:uncharacterized membrane protein YgdD (TMEM256/DUF423 family)